MKPLRQRKHDRLLNVSDTTRDEMAVDHAVAPFDRAVRESDRIWGTDRLPELVSPETAAKYGRTVSSLNAAITANDAERVADRAAACIRGLAAMDAEARSAGHQPLRSGVIVGDLDGWRFGILPDMEMWTVAEQEHPGLPCYSLREIGLLIRAAEGNHPLMEAARQAFPGSEIVAIRPQRSGPPPNDEIPEW